MDFTSFSFLILVTLFYFGLYLLYKYSNNSNKIIDYIIFSSLFLYGLWSPAALIIILYVIIVTIIFVHIIQKYNYKSKSIFLFSILAVLFPLITFKYTKFLLDSFGINNDYTSGWLLPLGISFYVFTSIGILSDVYTKKEQSILSIKQIFLLISYWPHLAAGPILRTSFITKHFFDYDFKKTIPTAMVMIIGGASKKLFIADNLGAYVNHNISQGIMKMDAITAVLTIFGFGGQIYADFSGYSEMAIGFSLLIGLHIPANFNYPYSAKSIVEFWHRWHISLSTWFRDYVYIPLGGNKKGIVISYFNILLVFVVSGLWHGASLNFLLWGFIHGLLLIVNRLYIRIWNRNLGWFSWVLTFVIVNLSWSFFMLDIDSAFLINSIIFSVHKWTEFKLDTMFYILPIVFMLLILFFDHHFKYYTVNSSGEIVVFEKRSKTKTYLYLWGLFTMAVFFSGKNLPFIYFEF